MVPISWRVAPAELSAAICDADPNPVLFDPRGLQTVSKAEPNMPPTSDLPTGIELNTLNPAFRDNPHPILHRLRSDAPVLRDPGSERVPSMSCCCDESVAMLALARGP